MKLPLTITLLIFYLHSFAQTKVDGEDYTEASNVAVEAVDSGIIGINNSYVDYNITVTKNTTYYFTFRVMGNGYINVKTPTGTKILARADVVTSSWSDITAQVKLSTTTKKIRFVINGNINLNYFTYGLGGFDSASDKVSRQEFMQLKNDLIATRKTLDSLNVSIKNNVYQFDPDKFQWKNGDSTKKVISIRSAAIKK